MGEDTSEASSDGSGESDDRGAFTWEAIDRGRRGPDEEEAAGDDAEPSRRTGDRKDRVWDRFGAEEPTTAKDDEEPGEGAASPPAEPESDEGTDSGEAGFERVWDTMDEDGPGAGAGGATEESEADQAGGGGGTVAESVTAEEDEDESARASRFDDLLGEGESAERSSAGSRGRSSGTDLASLFDDLDEFDRATSGSQVLVVSPREHTITDQVCSHYLTSGNQSSRNVLFVTTAQTPRQRLDICVDSEQWSGGRVGVIELGDVMTDSPPPDGFDPIDGNPVTYKRVSSVKNFSKLGLLITQMLKDWSETGQPSVLCFHTLSTISGYVQRETLFRFLFTLQAKLSSLGVTAHYHLDAGAHDAQEVATFKPIFDLVIDVDQDGRIELD